MNSLRILTHFYGLLYNRKGIPSILFSPLRWIVRNVANKVLPQYLSKPIISNHEIRQDVVVSLTSFPARIGIVWQVIECMLRQSYQPFKVILWLSRDQFPSQDSIPQSLTERVGDVFEIRLVDGDIRSHKKYYYAFKEFPNKTIITVDDDIYYDPNTIKRLLDTSNQYSKCIVSNHTRQIAFDNEKQLKPYKTWRRDILPNETCDLVQIGIGGVLYPPSCLHEMVLNKDLFVKLAPLADDIWLNMMARLENTPIVQATPLILPLPILSKAPSLTEVNNGLKNLNDKQIGQIREYLVANGFSDVYRFDYHVLA